MATLPPFCVATPMSQSLQYVVELIILLVLTLGVFGHDSYHPGPAAGHTAT